MDGQNQTEVTAVAEEAKKVIGSNNDTFELFRFDKESKDAGFGYWFRSFNCDTDEQAEKSLDIIVDSYGATKIVQLINSSLKASISRKCKSQIPKEEAARLKAIEETGGILVSKEDAEKFVPGEREASIQKLGKELQKAMNEGRMEDAQRILNEMNERCKAVNDALPDDEDEAQD